jgi:ParB-like chromosome segregation protein Spo0J
MHEMQIADIRIGNRVRKDMGDLDALAHSIQQYGLIHPPAVTAAGVLIAGHRRLLACTRLGMTSIPVRIIDVNDLLCAERDENQVRKDFTPSEAVAVARAIEAQLKAASKARRSAGAKARWAREKGQKIEFDDSSNSTRVDSSKSAAEVVGMCRQRYEQAKEVVEAAEQEAEKFGDIVEAMDATGNVRAAHTELRRRRDNIPTRHVVLRKMRYRDPNQEIERAITSMSGLILGIERIDVTGLDATRVEEWTAELKRHVVVINRFLRKLQA